jgi:hypothetical protein
LFSSPKIVCYTLSTSERKFDYQTPKKQNAEIKGNMIKRIVPKEAKEDLM